MLKRKIAVLLAVVPALLLSGCKADKAVSTFDASAQSDGYSEELIAENKNFRLSFDAFTKGIKLTELSTGTEWGTTPPLSGEDSFDELGMPKKRHDMVNSPIVVTCCDLDSGNEQELYSYSSAVTEGEIRCEKTENGLTVEYYFTQAEIMVPVTYTLDDDSVNISVDPKKIQEGFNAVTSVSLAPFFCSAENDTEDSYLFIPSGSGAVVSTDTLSYQGTKYSEPVFGKDYTAEERYAATNKEEIKMPVYGSVSAGSGTFAIIESGAESALIDAVVGSDVYEYSSVYATFQLRGYTTHVSAVFGDTNISNIYSVKMIDTPLSVRLYPLSGNDAGYVGMARIYREYLIENGLEENGKEASKLNLNFVGGTEITRSFFGIPYKTVFRATTVDDVKDIVGELSESIDGFSVNLKGFTEKGADIGKIGGGGLNSSLGGEKDMKQLSELCVETGCKLYMDFDIVRFSSSSAGFNTFFDSTVTPGNENAAKYIYDKSVRDDILSSRYYLLSPSKFEKAVDKVLDSAEKWSLDGVTLSTFSSMCYSDYRDRENTLYYAKSGFADTVVSSSEKICEGGKDFVSSGANIYAAVLSDLIIDAPLNSSGEQVFEYDIPFYQMVLRGSVPISACSVNLSDDMRKTVLAAVESGSGISWTVTNEWSNEIADSYHPYFYSGRYSMIKDDIISLSSELSEYYKKIGNAHIAGHSVLSDGVRKTEFDNAVSVYVNYNGYSVKTPVGEIEAYGYKVVDDGQ